MKTINDLVQMIKAGQRPVVSFRKRIEEKECYAEENMRARLARPVDIQSHEDEVVGLAFDFEPFDAHNRTLESATYYDKSGEPTLTAREAGYYKPVEVIYFDRDEPLDAFMTIQSQDRAQLHMTFAASVQGTNLSYVEWLEDTVLSLQQQARERNSDPPTQDSEGGRERAARQRD